MSIKRKWLKVLLLSMMALSSFGGAPMNVKEIEELLHIMNETKVEFTIPDEGDPGDGIPPSELGIVQPEGASASSSENDE
jgi:hypothetical protein